MKNRVKVDLKFAECSSAYPSNLEDSSVLSEFAQGTYLGERTEAIEQGSQVLVPALSLLSTYDRAQ